MDDITSPERNERDRDVIAEREAILGSAHRAASEHAAEFRYREAAVVWANAAEALIRHRHTPVVYHGQRPPGASDLWEMANAMSRMYAAIAAVGVTGD